MRSTRICKSFHTVSSSLVLKALIITNKQTNNISTRQRRNTVFIIQILKDLAIQYILAHCIANRFKTCGRGRSKRNCSCEAIDVVRYLHKTEGLFSQAKEAANLELRSNQHLQTAHVRTAIAVKQNGQLSKTVQFDECSSHSSTHRVQIHALSGHKLLSSIWTCIES